MDGKLVLGFLADILYLKGYINFDEFDAIMDAKDAKDLNAIFEKMYADEFKPYRKGEAYGTLI